MCVAWFHYILPDYFVSVYDILLFSYPCRHFNKPTLYLGSATKQTLTLQEIEFYLLLLHSFKNISNELSGIAVA